MIRPVTDLRNHFPEVEASLKESGTVFLTKNGYSAAVLLSMDEYKELTGKNENPVSSKKKKPSSDRGFLSKYANQELKAREKDAGRNHVLSKRTKYELGAADDE